MNKSRLESSSGVDALSCSVLTVTFDLSELVGFSGVCPGCRDLVPRPHDGDVLR